MTKKDYELIAKRFNEDMDFLTRNYPYQAKTLKAFAIRLAISFEVNNPRFKRNKFLQACGIED